MDTHEMLPLVGAHRVALVAARGAGGSLPQLALGIADSKQLLMGRRGTGYLEPPKKSPVSCLRELLLLLAEVHSIALLKAVSLGPDLLLSETCTSAKKCKKP